MKRIALALALLAMAPATADAKCFLFFCPWHPYHYRRATNEAPVPVSAFCKGVLNAADKSKVSDDDFIAAFPSAEQSKVKACLGASQ